MRSAGLFNESTTQPRSYVRHRTDPLFFRAHSAVLSFIAACSPHAVKSRFLQQFTRNDRAT
jgi:hypothetical protein